MNSSQLLSVLVLLVCCLLFFCQCILDGKNFDFLDAKNLFQIYYIIQLPLNLVLATCTNISNYEAVGSNTSQSLVQKLVFLLLIGQISFIVGSRLDLKTLYGGRLHPKIDQPQATLSRMMLKDSVLYCAFLVVSIVSFWALVYKNGGITSFLSNREYWRTEGMVGQGFLFFPCTSLIWMVSNIIILRYSDWFRSGSGITKIILIEIFAITPSLVLGFRGLILSPILQLLWIYSKYVNKVKLIKISIFATVLIFAFVLYGVARSAESDFSELTVESVITAVDKDSDLIFSPILRSKGIDVLAVIVNAVDVRGSDANFLDALIESLTIVVPKSLWTAKPRSSTEVFSREYFDKSGGVSPTIVGHGYLNGDIFGVILECGFLGLLCGWHKWYSEQGKHRIKHGAFLASIVVLLVMSSESPQGNFNGIFLNLSAYLILIQIFK